MTSTHIAKTNKYQYKLQNAKLLFMFYYYYYNNVCLCIRLRMENMYVCSNEHTYIDNSLFLKPPIE